jgi:hypothetical protein
MSKAKYSKVTAELLKKHSACTDGYRYVADKGWLSLEAVPLIRNLMTDKKYDWSNWLIVRVMERKQYLTYAIYAAEQVIDIYEKQYPKDDRPRKAIEAAKAYLKNPTAENKAAAHTAAGAAHAAANAAFAAATADAAANAAFAAAHAAFAAATADAAAHAADAAATADAKKQMQIKILEYGLSLLANDVSIHAPTRGATLLQR